MEGTHNFLKRGCYFGIRKLKHVDGIKFKYLLLNLSDSKIVNNNWFGLGLL